MKKISMLFLLIALLMMSCKNGDFRKEFDQAEMRFNIQNDLLLLHYDCKTDVDDLHSVAAAKTILSSPAYSGINAHAVAGSYGIQEGLYVPANDLFQLAFDSKWSDAHSDWDKAIIDVYTKAESFLENGGDIWIADAGQSDFTADLLKMIMVKMPEISIKDRIHVVQHSDWNESVTTPQKLQFVKESASYHKIPDGNATGNGTPGFRSADVSYEEILGKNKANNEVWSLAINLGNKYNGVEGRYLNEAIKLAGLDFSDTSELCWILNLENIEDIRQYIERFID